MAMQAEHEITSGVAEHGGAKSALSIVASLKPTMLSLDAKHYGRKKRTDETRGPMKQPTGSAFSSLAVSMIRLAPTFGFERSMPCVWLW